MAPVCVRVAFIGGGQGEPSRWADRYSLRCACDTEAGIVANQNEKTARSTWRDSNRPTDGTHGARSDFDDEHTAGEGSKAFSESSVPICDTRGRSGPKVSKRREPGGNRQSEGTKAKPRKPNDFNGFRGSNPGGGYEIRTREAVTPTRFPSVRHRPLGESSIALFAAAFWPQQTTRREYHRLADKQNRRVLCVCRAWWLARPGSLRRSDARIQ